jgi:SAM-dependent methyltransferase
MLMNTSTKPAHDPATEAELTHLIDPWLQHMRWRADWDRWRDDRIWQEQRQHERLETIGQFGGQPQGLRILGTSVALALRGAAVVASEFNPAYCRITHLRARRYQLGLPVVNAAGEALPYRDQAFDLALCWDVVEHVQDAERLIAELGRVVRPGGRVLLTVINRLAWRDPHYHLLGINYLPRSWAEMLIRWRGRSKATSALQDKQRLGEMHYFTLPQFRALAQRHGFALWDIREERLRQGAGTARGLKGRVRDALRRVGVVGPAYRLYRTFIQGTWEFVLVRR